MFRIGMAQISHDFHSDLRRLLCISETCLETWILGFLLDVISSKTSLRLLSCFGFAWITLDPLRRKVLRNHCIFVMHCWFLLFIENFVVCFYHSLSAISILSTRSSGFLRHGVLVTFERLHTSQFGSLGKWVKKLGFLPALFEVVSLEDALNQEVLALVFPRQLERRLSNLTISLLILP